MIIEVLLNILYTVLTVCIGWLPNLPDIPDSFYNSISNVFDIIGDNVGLLHLFIDLPFCLIVLPLFLLVINFDKIWDFIKFILTKLHIIGGD